MKREELIAKGLTPEQVDFVMSEYGKEVNPLIAERDGFKAQLSAAQSSLKALDGINVTELQNQITKLSGEITIKEAEVQRVKGDAQFNELIKDAIRSAGARNEKAVIPFLNIDELKQSKNQTEDIKAALESVKKDNDYLFQESQAIPRVVSTTPGINQDADSKKTQANEALRGFFGRE